MLGKVKLVSITSRHGSIMSSVLVNLCCSCGENEDNNHPWTTWKNRHGNLLDLVFFFLFILIVRDSDMDLRLIFSDDRVSKHFMIAYQHKAALNCIS